ncbi:MAG: NADH-quinone oxidoreductase subunit NuoK [Acidobacteriota bacterium]|uniref:NADH-quinone oxidoreductase subunit NuoK n=1 Tax=Fundidesulfovibrio putealis TaxID=270496 RepID=UPI00040CD5F8|nr:NADH-quinone oxidoreductase subunit K [Fundidesulfovibrio putealis]
MNALALYQLVALGLLAVGLFGLFSRASLVGMLISVELMLNGAGLAVVAAGQLTPMPGEMSQATALFIMGLAAAESTLVLAIVYVVRKRFGSASSATPSELKG